MPEMRCYVRAIESAEWAINCSPSCQRKIDGVAGDAASRKEDILTMLKIFVICRHLLHTNKQDQKRED